ncbi:Glyoxylase, beta-lactamase superfamily II [Actinopolymorpha cephalotaxi]|uniref:Glyoxylase, beta-lactamase superfamily II n=1 Tax=Actinopolymorpha cephalotaxi TaxID=504797 RepID=A0A1I2PK32_9ACTN|nr:MBL fold metallo-hydrolase [Actinopolymorpha cephalotaxi]NYH83598.1 glyoxylase-like metal-dependent hydrolase (beta-lactamase superfamily II) [Actinopolymorpha cephalotaxi]SFG15783.1 Glyoxylase, beta-lactamase superfamily II [Actinopolymorpha cephalotaxi]
MKATTVVPGVYRIRHGFVSSYVVESDDGLVLVDTGERKGDEDIAEGLRQLGREAAQIRRILVTHHHPDHVGGLAAMVRRTGASVYAHPVDAGVVRGETPRQWPQWQGVVARVLGPLVVRMNARSEEPEPAAVDVEVDEGERLPFAGGIRVIHTPGHTRGHLSFLLERDGGTLLVGDAAVNLAGIRSPASRAGEIVTEDLPAAARSFRRLGEFDFEKAVFGHGEPILSGASERFRRRAARGRSRSQDTP